MKMITAIGLLVLGTSAAAQTPVHDFRLNFNGLDAVGTAVGQPGNQVSFTNIGVPIVLGAAMKVGQNGNAPGRVVTVPQNEVVNFSTGDFAIAVWVRRTADDLNAHGIADAQNGTGRGWQLNFAGNDVVRFRMYDGSDDANVTTTATIGLQTWHHIVVTVDRDDPLGMRFYIDGVLDSEHDPTAVTGEVFPNQDLWLGGLGSNTSGLFGELASVQIYTDNLTALEIADLADRDRVSHQYDFEGTASDSIGVADGTAGANVVFESTGVPQGLGSAAVFSGSGGDAANTISVPQALLTPFNADDFSFSIWVRRDDVGGSDGVFDMLGGSIGIQTQFRSDSTLRVRVDDDAAGQLSFETQGSITDGLWNHLCFTMDRDATDGARWYVNGVLDSIGDPTSLTGSIPIGQDLIIGTVNSFGLEGALARLVFHDRSLTADEVARLADLDGDTVPYASDICLGADDADDIDADGTPDGCDLCFGSDNIDTDGDGVCDSLDICENADDLADEDGDGVPDACDICFGPDNIDTDGDGICDSVDACHGFDDSRDSDGDGVPDACDACFGFDDLNDSDSDGVPNRCDVCPGFDDAIDSDGDGAPDGCDSDVVIYVVDGGTPGADGRSWSTAFDLQAALAAAQPGDEIWVAQGIYAPSQSDPAMSFALPDSVRVLGGFAGTESASAQRDATAHETVLSGDLPNGTSNDNASHHVLTATSTTVATVLDGFTIQDGYARGGENNNEGGALHHTAAGLTISNCRFEGNRAVQRGGAIYSNAGLLRINDCVFHDNMTLVDGNEFSAQGGAVYINGGTVLLTNCILDLNQVDDRSGLSGIDTRVFGGAVYQSSGILTAVNCTFTDNRARGNIVALGGALFLDTSAQTWLVNCSFNGNEANHVGGGFGSVGFNGDGGAIWTGGSTAIDNCILWGNTASGQGAELERVEGSLKVRYSIVQGGYAGEQVLTLDPVFVSGGSVEIMATSPAIDAGDTFAVPRHVTTDLAGNPRITNNRNRPDTGLGSSVVVDMGAYEQEWSCNCPGDVDGDCDADLFDIETLIVHFGRTVTSPGTSGDLSNDGRVGMVDLRVAIDNFNCTP
ncbi:MAG: LamG-like jellyroll fold domain-containing protein [Planctomycetota bacterium]